MSTFGIITPNGGFGGAAEERGLDEEPKKISIYQVTF